MRHLSILLLLVLAPLSAASSAPAETPASRRHLNVAAASDVAVLATADGLWVERDGGKRVPLPFPRGSAIDRLASDGVRWVAAGHRTGDAGAELVLALGERGGVRPLTPPQIRGAALVLSANPLLAADGLVGLAWLQGDHATGLEVRAARLEGGVWGETETVSPAGPGSQMSLSGAVLADGSSLLVWAAFDGRDDEILWSRFADGGWSPPRRLAAENELPDVTPRIVAWDGGALAAWSRYVDGSYRVQLARFEGEEWSPVRTVSGPGGGGPSFVTGSSEDPPLLLYRRSVPAAWVIAELDANATVRARATVEVRGDELPRVAIAGDGVEVAWGDGSAERVGWALEP